MLTVTTPATNARLTTVAAVRAQFGITTDQLNDASVEALIDRASDAAASFCNRVFGVESVRETLRDVSNRASIYLDRTPVHLSTIAIVEDAVTLVSGADFAFDARRGALARLMNDCPAFWSAQKIVIDYDAGYVLPDDDGTRTLPHDVETAAIYLAGDMWRVIQQGQLGAIKREMVEGVAQIEWWQPLALGRLSNQVSELLLAPYHKVAL